MRKTVQAFAAGFALLAAPIAQADDGARLLTIDHYVRVKSTAPSIAGQDAQLYLREVVRAGPALRGGPAGSRVVLFVHGAGTPSSVSFDVPYQDYSWMAYLANAGFDVFLMDLTGYGRSTRPPQMNDPCNASKAAQAQFVPSLIPAVCAPSDNQPISTSASDWADVGAVVDHLRALRGVDKVSIVAWSQGGVRTVPYAISNAAKVERLVLLAPLYTRTAASAAPARFSYNDGVMSAQSQAEFMAGWDRQVGCADQYDPAIAPVIWQDMRASDPVGATWGPGVRRSPQVPIWGFNQQSAARLRTPVLMVVGANDRSVAPDRIRELYADVGSKQKVFVDLACSSHNAMWEKNHLLLFQASLEFLRDGKVNGQSEGMLKLGY